MKDYDDKSGLAYYWLEANMGRVLLVVLFAGLGLWGLLLEGLDDLDLGRRLVRGIGPELAGIIIAAVTIDALAQRRQDEERKRILIRQLGSQYRDVTETAVIELREREWLFDGTLCEANLSRANLSQADLSQANLCGANLKEANLAGSDLHHAALTDADLGGADLSRANLRGADLTKASLTGTDLTAAELSWADLSQAMLIHSNLRFAQSFEANLNGACLIGAVLENACFVKADWRDIDRWKVEQFNQALELDGSIMPDEEQLELVFELSSIPGLSYDEWKAQYLAQHGGTETDLRGN